MTYKRNESDGDYLKAINVALRAVEAAYVAGLPLRNDCEIASDRAAALTESLDALQSAMGNVRLAEKWALEAA